MHPARPPLSHPSVGPVARRRPFVEGDERLLCEARRRPSQRLRPRPSAFGGPVRLCRVHRRGLSPMSPWWRVWFRRAFTPDGLAAIRCTGRGRDAGSRNVRDVAGCCTAARGHSGQDWLEPHRTSATSKSEGQTRRALNPDASRSLIHGSWSQCADDTGSIRARQRKNTYRSRRTGKPLGTAIDGQCVDAKIKTTTQPLPNAGSALGGSPGEAARTRRRVSSLRDEAAGDPERKGPRADSGSVAERPVALARRWDAETTAMDCKQIVGTAWSNAWSLWPTKRANTAA